MNASPHTLAKLGLLLTLTALSVSRVQAANPQSTPVEPPSLIEPPSGEPRIQGLNWDPSSLRLIQENLGLELRWSVLLQGTWTSPDWVLLQGGAPVQTDPTTRRFQAQFPVYGQTASGKFSAVGPLGELETEEVKIRIPDFGERQKADIQAPSRRLFSYASLGLSSVHYTETTREDYDALNLTARFSGLYLITPQRWEVAWSAYTTAFHFLQTPSDSIRFLGLNLRAGYIIPIERSRWRVSILGGAYYTTTFVPGGSYGFQNMLGPQLYPNMRYTLSTDSSLSAYIKYSPVSGSGVALLPASNFEFATGCGYLRDLPGGRSWGIALDYAQIQLSFSLVHITAQSLSLGATFGF